MKRYRPTSLMRLLNTSIMYVILSIFPLFAAANEQGKLHIGTWYSYIHDETISEFEKENNCTIYISYFESVDAVISEVAIKGGAIYDVMIGTDHMLCDLHNEGHISLLPLDEMPNLRAIHSHLDKYIFYPNVLPYTISYSYLLAREEVYQEGIDDTWGILDNPILYQRYSLLKDMREVLGAALIYADCDVNTDNPEDLIRIESILKRWRNSVVRLDSEMFKTSIATKELYLSGSDIQKIIMENPKHIVPVFPKEGLVLCIDSIAISSTAKNKALAIKFVDFLYRKDIIKKNQEVHTMATILDKNMWGTANRGPNEETIKNSQILRSVSAETYKKYYNIWQKFLYNSFDN